MNRPETVARESERRIERELETVRAMIDLYCRDHHETTQELCPECRGLWDYAHERVDRCPLRPEKPTCKNCTVHCYKPAMRARIREVMRYAGPRMTWHHPVLSLYHLIDDRRPPPPRRKTS